MPTPAKVMVVFGTRPEVIKCAPLVHELKRSSLQVVTCATAQHRQLLDQELEFFGIEPEHDLNLMKPNQGLFEITESCLRGLQTVLKKEEPSMVLVQGDTTTAFTAGLAAFYLQIPVGHIEAGLRTGNPYSPFPEEMNRCLLGRIAHLHFAPTPKARESLLSEGIEEKKILLTGNTGIDALFLTRDRLSPKPALAKIMEGKKAILMTTHRRENFGPRVEGIFHAVRKFAEDHEDFQIVYPVHPNPNVLGPAKRILGNTANIHLLEPLPYDELVYALAHCHCVLTDSGGIQEEAPSFAKPVVVLRETTERTEAITAGCAVLAGHHSEKILNYLEELADPKGPRYQAMSKVENPFGDGKASQRICKTLEDFLRKAPSQAA